MSYQLFVYCSPTYGFRIRALDLFYEEEHEAMIQDMDGWYGVYMSLCNLPPHTRVPLDLDIECARADDDLRALPTFWSPRI